MKVWSGIPFVWSEAPIRAHGFYEFSGYFRVWRDLGRGGGLVDQDWWQRVGVLINFPGIPLFWAVSPVRDSVF